MIKTIEKLIQYPCLTQDYPNVPLLADPFFGKPVIDPNACTRCGICAARCPSGAIVAGNESKGVGVNLDECVFCALCEEVCPTGAIKMTQQFELAEFDRDLLRHSPPEHKEKPSVETLALEKEVRRKIQRIFGRSLQIREVDAGSCNGCDYEINGLNNPFNDIERFGISFVASPRHADMLLVTGTVTRNMQTALQKTYDATPDPKLVVAVGACACSGGIFKGGYASGDGIDAFLPVDVYVPGCPPRPHAILYGILKALDRVKKK